MPSRRRPTWPAMLALIGVAAITVATIAAAWTMAGAAPGHGESQTDDPVAAAAAAYAFHCATCHGSSGSGLVEARERFPADHVYCERCHQRNSPARMTQREMELQQVAFSLGEPPPLDAGRLARFGSAEALFGYIRTAMPRWDPGRLSDDDYVAVTLYVLVLAGLLGPEDAAAVTGRDDLAAIVLSPERR